MLIRANRAGMILHIYFSIIYQIINWLKARETRRVEKGSDVKASKAKWPDVVRVGVGTTVIDGWREGRTGRGGRGKGRFTLACRWQREGSELFLRSCPSSEMAGKASYFSQHLLAGRWPEQQNSCQLTPLWTAGNTKYPNPCFPGRILLLTFHWHASHINATSAGNQSQRSPSPPALHTSSQQDDAICCLSAFRIRHLEDETFLPSPGQ